jgi:8-oxo-dGTP pyrophosphatase MutT (NUDIX family)
MDRDEISRRLCGSLTVEEALAYGFSAIRETFEEAGLFLGRMDQQSSEDLKKLCDRRLSEGLPKGWFWEWILSKGWVLSFSNLARWAHWITPELMPKHFDTRFFVAFMPSDQSCIPDDRETTDGIWLNPRKALFRNLEGEVPLSPPTLVTLHEFLEYPTLADLKRELETRSWGDPRFPRMIRLPEGTIILQPWDPERYEEVEFNPKELEKALLPVGEPFSRIWLHEGIWRPIGY